MLSKRKLMKRSEFTERLAIDLLYKINTRAAATLYPGIPQFTQPPSITVKSSSIESFTFHESGILINSNHVHDLYMTHIIEIWNKRRLNFRVKAVGSAPQA